MAEPYFLTNMIRRGLRREPFKHSCTLDEYTARKIGMLPSVFESEVNEQLDKLQKELHTLKR